MIGRRSMVVVRLARLGPLAILGSLLKLAKVEKMLFSIGEYRYSRPPWQRETPPQTLSPSDASVKRFG